MEDIEKVVLKTPAHQSRASVNGDDLLILIEYARQCEAVIMMMDEDPKKAKEVFKH